MKQIFLLIQFIKKKNFKKEFFDKSKSSKPKKKKNELYNYKDTEVK